MIWLLPHKDIIARLTPQVRVTDHSSTASTKEERVRFQISNLDFFYGAKQAVFGVNLKIPANKVTALIGPSGCGKSTFLRTLNRMNDTIRHSRYSGEILLDGQDIRQMDVVKLRRRVGMVFQRPIPFRNRFLTMSRTGCASTVTKEVFAISSSTACGAPRSGTK